MSTVSSFRWAVIGAGGAGIAAVGKFCSEIPSNTSVGLFLRFLQNCRSFGYQITSDFSLNQQPHEQTCYLADIVEPLCWVTEHLREQVNSIKTKVIRMHLARQQWHLQCDEGEQITAKGVILAVGAQPKRLALSGPIEIPLQDAMVVDKLAKYITKEDRIAVFGSSHSAILVLRALSQLSVAQIINFYRSPLCYAVNLEDWILFDNTGLKGLTAQWAREHLEDVLPDNLHRVYSNKDNVGHWLPICSKVVYAVGFEPRINIDVEGVDLAKYHPQTGIIAPGLFGLGIAYPQGKLDPLGSMEMRVGLWKFMDYLNQIMPIWFCYLDAASYGCVKYIPLA